MIVLPEDILTARAAGAQRIDATFRRADGEVYSAIAAGAKGGSSDVARGSVFVTDRPLKVSEIGTDTDEVRVLARPPAGRGPWSARGFVLRDGGWVEVAVMLVPVREELFSRTRGIFETDVLARKRVFTAGLGSGGAPIVMELAKLGVGQTLMDHDRLEVANIGRHVLGLSDVGRLKAKAMAEKVLDKNPYAEVQALAEKITWDNQDRVRELVRGSDLTICGVDDHDARVILNKACVAEGKVMIMAAAFRRAYGGQVLVVRPGCGPCYQCFLAALPQQARDQEVSSEDVARRLAYSDRPVAVEPGLSTDIAPISLMVVKLAIQHLLGDRDTTLRSLDEDLAAPWFLWLNRREAQTQYEGLDPMSFHLDGLSVLRWYGLPLDRNEACPCCGDFLGAMARKEGLQIHPEMVAAYAGGTPR